MTIKSFRRASASIPRFGAKKPGPIKRFDGSARERGYDSDWAKLAKRYRKAARGLCQECERRGIVKVADVVDHMIPIKDAPNLRLDWNNLDALCHRCHNGLKRRIEQYARKTDQVFLIPQWMKFPELRPMHFQFGAQGLVVEGGVAYNQTIDPEAEPATPFVAEVSQCPVEVFSGSGSLVSLTNHCSFSVEIFDGEALVQIIQDGGSLRHPIIIKEGLSVDAPQGGAGKISLSYVEDRRD